MAAPPLGPRQRLQILVVVLLPLLLLAAWLTSKGFFATP
jgi:hypothetical protein